MKLRPALAAPRGQSAGRSTSFAKNGKAITVEARVQVDGCWSPISHPPTDWAVYQIETRTTPWDNGDVLYPETDTQPGACR